MADKAAPLILEIHFGKGRCKSGEILCYPGDNPNDLATAFCARHNIKTSAISIIEEHIRGYVSSSQVSTGGSPGPARLTKSPRSDNGSCSGNSSSLSHASNALSEANLTRETRRSSTSPSSPTSPTGGQGDQRVAVSGGSGVAAPLLTNHIRVEPSRHLPAGSAALIQSSFGTQSPVEMSPILQQQHELQQQQQQEEHQQHEQQQQQHHEVQQQQHELQSRLISRPSSSNSPLPGAVEYRPDRPEDTHNIHNMYSQASDIDSNYSPSEVASTRASNAFYGTSAGSTSSTRKPDNRMNQSVSPQHYEDKEDIFNSIKSAWMQTASTSINVSRLANQSRQLEGQFRVRGQKFVASPKDFAAKTTSSQKTTTTGSSSSQDTTSIAERLHKNAALSRQHRDKLKSAADEVLSRELQETRFKISDESRRLCNSKRVISQAPSILHRLYEEGLKEVDKKRHAPASAPTRIEDWSCAQCGTYHTIKKSQTTSASTAASGTLTCPVCNFQQKSAAPHKPILLINDHYDKLHLDKDELFRRRVERESMKKNKTKGPERPSFKPSLPEHSLKIVQHYVSKEKAAGARQDKPAASSEGGQGGAEAAEKGACTIGQYFQQDIYSRLANVDKKPIARRQVHLGLIFEADFLEGGICSVGGDAPSEAEKKINAMTMGQLIDRLTYEYKEKDARRLAEQERPMMDPLTNQPFFQPLLQPHSQGAGTCGVSYHEPSNSSEKRYLRDKVTDKSKLHMANHEKAIEGMLISPKPLPKSERIIDDATNKSIEVIFRILLAGTLISPSTTVPPSPPSSSNNNGLPMTLLLQHDSPDWPQRSLNLAKLRTDMLVPDLVQLVENVQEELGKVNAALQASPTSASLVSYELFNKLVRKSLKSPESLLRWRETFVLTPKRRSAYVLADEQPESFMPHVDPHSIRLAEAKRGVGREFHDVLYDEGHRTAARKQLAIEEHARAQADRDKTKPHIYKPPKSVKPKYRHVDAFLAPDMPEPAPRAPPKLQEEKQGKSRVPARALPPPPSQPEVSRPSDAKKGPPPPLPCELRENKLQNNRQLFMTPT